MSTKAMKATGTAEDFFKKKKKQHVNKNEAGYIQGLQDVNYYTGEKKPSIPRQIDSAV